MNWLVLENSQQVGSPGLLVDPDRIKANMADPVFIDCRNVYDPATMKDLGFRYDCFGR